MVMSPRRVAGAHESKGKKDRCQGTERNERDPVQSDVCCNVATV